MSKILIIQRFFPHYRRFIFDAISKEHELLLLHSNVSSNIKQIETTYSKKVRSWKYAKNETSIFLFVIRDILRFKPSIIIHEFAIGILSLQFVLAYCKLMNIKLVLWSHGYDRKKGFFPSSSIIDWIRLKIINSSNGIILYSNSDKEIIKKFVNPKHIFVAQNALNTNVLNQIQQELTIIGREEVKKKIGFHHKYNLIFIGRILSSKKPDYLIKAYLQLPKSIKDSTCIHFVGEGEYIEQLNVLIDKYHINSHVCFHGSIYDDYKNGELLYSSDLMVMPGELGLSVNYAFNFNCPVLSFLQIDNFPAHGPEVEYVKNDETGYLLMDHTESGLANCIANYLTDVTKQNRMRENVFDFSKNICNVENMVQGIRDCIVQIEK
jgi:glycosyltransferase involved in cell wall biosynthesis